MLRVKPVQVSTGQQVFSQATALDKEEAEDINDVIAGRSKEELQQPLSIASAEINAELRKFNR